jgi:hypothetical protein
MQSKAVQHCVAAFAFATIKLHNVENENCAAEYNRQSLHHNVLATTTLREDIASGRTAADAASTVSAIFLLGFLAVDICHQNCKARNC